MSRCPTINFHLSIISKWLAKHISIKISFKITTRKDMFILTLVDLEYETSVFIWEFEMMMVLILSFCLLFKWLPIEIHITQMKLILLMNTDTLICI